MQVKSIVLYTLLFTCYHSFAQQHPFGANNKLPNIVLINVDDLGWMDTATYGSTFYETPHIDKLRENGMLFTRNYAGAANCAPSRACLISGQNTPRHGIYTVGNSDRGNPKTRKLVPVPNNQILSDSIVTMAEMLKKAGYTTGIFGKWHLGKDPKTQGFDVNRGGGKAGGPGGNGYFSPYNVPNLEDGPKGENLTDRLTAEAIHFMESAGSAPFFTYMPFYAVHKPLETTPELLKKYDTIGNSYQDNATYAGMIETVDTNIGRIMNFLKTSGLEHNTLIIFTSDNGGIRSISSQHPLRAGKGSYYEGGIRVPLIIQWNSRVPANATVDTPVSHLDIYPTLQDIIGAKNFGSILDGTSLVPLFNGESLKKRNLYFHFPIYLQAYDPKADDGRDPLFRTRPGAVIIEDTWKLHYYYEDKGIELYDLDSDVGERNNLAETAPDKARDLLQKLRNWQTAVNAPLPTKINSLYDSNFEVQKK